MPDLRSWPKWTRVTEQLIERAQTADQQRVADASLQFEQVRKIEPRLRTWAELAPEKRQRYLCVEVQDQGIGSNQTTCRAFSTGFTEVVVATSKTYMGRGSDSRWSRPPPKDMGEVWK